MSTQEVGCRLVFLHILKRKFLTEHTAGCELYPGQLHLLDAVILSPGLTQQAAASCLGVSAASVAQSVKRLEHSGLLKKEPDPQNLRKNRLYATPAGIAAADAYRKSFDQVDGAMFSGFSSEDLTALTGYLDRMIENLKPEDFDLSRFPFRKDCAHD